MTLNDTELREKVRKHCGEKIAKGESPCEGCKKKLHMARVIERQKDFCWREHEHWRRHGEDEPQQRPQNVARKVPAKV